MSRMMMGPVGPQGRDGLPGISPKEIEDIKEYVDMIMSVLGDDLTFDKFQGLTNAERKALIRDIKITMITQE